jgi:hypothetical protein
MNVICTICWWTKFLDQAGFGYWTYLIKSHRFSFNLRSISTDIRRVTLEDNKRIKWRLSGRMVLSYGSSNIGLSSSDTLALLVDLINRPEAYRVDSGCWYRGVMLEGKQHFRTSGSNLGNICCRCKTLQWNYGIFARRLLQQKDTWRLTKIRNSRSGIRKI